MGYEVTSIAYADETIARASVMDVELGTGEHVRVDAFGRDQRDARIAAKVWHRAMYHDPGVPVFGSRIQQVEHIGFTLMLAERADVSRGPPRPHRRRRCRRRGARHHAPGRHADRRRSRPSASPMRCSRAAWQQLDRAAPRGDRARQPRRRSASW